MIIDIFELSKMVLLAFAAAPDDDETASVHTLHSVLDPEPELEPAASVPVPFQRASN